MDNAKIIIPIKGMHCRSCELILEGGLSEVDNVEKVEVSHTSGQATIYHRGDATPSLKSLEHKVESLGYQIGQDSRLPWLSHRMQDWQDLLTALVVLLAIYLVVRLGGFDQVQWLTSQNKLTLPLVAVVGLVAGVSTCMAMIGGLVMGISSSYAQSHPNVSAGKKFTPHLWFNAGRILGFFILGSLLGLLGSAFHLSVGLSSLLIIAVAIIMLMMGLKLLAIFPRLDKWQVSLPKAIGRYFNLQKNNGQYSFGRAALVGALTFFLPCGFTQAMQVLAISSGNWLTAGLIMSFFALGTSVGLLSIGGLTSFIKGKWSTVAFRFIGLLLIAFAIFNFNNGLQLFKVSGWKINWDQPATSQASAQTDPNVQMQDGVQIVHMTETSRGYSPNNFTISKDLPVRWIIDAQAVYSCASTILVPSLKIQKSLTQGDNTIEFTPSAAGTIPFSCSMGMYTGVFNVVDSQKVNDNNLGVPTAEASANTPTVAATKTGGSCSVGASGSCGCGGAASKKISDTAAANKNKVTPAKIAKTNGQPVQILRTVYTAAKDIQPSSFKVKAGVPVKLLVDVKDDGSGCMSHIMIPGLYNTPLYLQSGTTLSLDFTPRQPGSYMITCAMNVPRGYLVVD